MKLTTTGKTIALMLPTILTMVYFLIVGFIRMPEFATSGLDFQLKFAVYHTGTQIMYITLITLAIWYAVIKNRLKVAISLLAIALLMGVASYFASQDNDGADGADGSVAEMPSTTAEEKVDVRSMKFLMQVASELNKNLPMMIDKDTELSASMGKEGELQYVYNIVTYNKKDFTEDHLKNIQTQVTNGACTAPDSTKFLSQGVNLTYSYYDKNRIHFLEFTVTPKDCKRMSKNK